MASCEICGKRHQTGNNVSRLGKNAIKRRVLGRSKRTFKPNLQHIRVWSNGSTRRVYACTECIRTGRVQKPPIHHVSVRPAQ